eukprot:COSAG06_NODE_13324_length_1268_cov_1.602224_1_plen_182_part_00
MLIRGPQLPSLADPRRFGLCAGDSLRLDEADERPAGLALLVRGAGRRGDELLEKPRLAEQVVDAVVSIRQPRQHEQRAGPGPAALALGRGGRQLAPRNLGRRGVVPQRRSRGRDDLGAVRRAAVCSSSGGRRRDGEDRVAVPQPSPAAVPPEGTGPGHPLHTPIGDVHQLWRRRADGLHPV